MLSRRVMVRVLMGMMMVGLWVAAPLAVAADRKEPDKGPAKRGGRVVGVITARGPTWIEVRADGEEKARRYVPHWRGGLPKDGGGLDRTMLETIRKLEVGSRVRLQWEFQERPRVVKIEVLRPAKKDK